MKTTGIKKNLTLDKIRGIRIDTGPVTYVPVKKEEKFPEEKRIRKLKQNTTRDGLKY